VRPEDIERTAQFQLAREEHFLPLLPRRPSARPDNQEGTELAWDDRIRAGRTRDRKPGPEIRRRRGGDKPRGRGGRTRRTGLGRRRHLDLNVAPTSTAESAQLAPAALATATDPEITCGDPITDASLTA
jgi:hypothetical protein